ncbi:MAG: hypothetical protein LBT00_10540 [Spirochaetaceae bacterium]|jgi:RNA ligase (TIGR02306 family)|nr:hypothetical protein [Spirochaetaceae bacterium]
MERTLAYIATIARLDKIPDKDRIVYASFKNLGWQVIVDTAHQVGDKVVYIEIDAILPVKPEYEFLRKRCYSERWEGFVIKGMKMAGLISYGLVLPLPAGYEDKPDGFDMTEVLEIRKRDDDSPAISAVPPTFFEKVVDRFCTMLGIKRTTKKIGVSGGWLSFAQKTDETRIENLPYLFEDKFKGTPVYTTVKCDGQSVTFAVFMKHFFIASRNVVLYRGPIRRAIRELNPQRESRGLDNFRKIASRLDLPRKMLRESVRQGRDFVIQGELCGPSIQKNPMGLPGLELFVFNGYYPAVSPEHAPIGGEFCSWDGITKICSALGLKTVPFIERRQFDWPDQAALKAYAKGKYPNGKDREGVVIRYDSGTGPVPEALYGMSNMWSFKCINDDYILGK